MGGLPSRFTFGIALLLIGSVACTQDRPGAASSTGATTEVPSATPSSDAQKRHCAYPSVRPTYLPWRHDGEIPRPRRSYDEEIDRAALVWTNPDNEKQGFALTVYPVDRSGGPEEPIGVTIQGAEGYLHEGSPGEHGAWWDLPDVKCSFLELIVSLNGMSPAEQDAEVIKIARSLREGRI